MEIKIQSIHFDATEKLEAFIEKKVAKLEKAFEDVQKVEVQCKVVKPATAQNKQVSLNVTVPGTTLFVEKVRVRNYTLFRYMLGCNSRGQWPTKFNGGLFTFDPEYVNPAEEYRLSPDYRNWGGGVHTAQNQRLVYWPMLKNGDFDLLRPQLDFYLNIYKNAEERSRLYWGHEGACLTEQIENYGLPCYPEYGTKRPAGFDPGLERNAWLEYEWDTCLEFCMMALEAHRYSGMDIEDYMPMIRSCLRFFDEHYQYLANQRGAKRLDGNGKLVLYPGSGGETFKGAYNSTSTIAALRTVAEAVGIPPVP